MTADPSAVPGQASRAWVSMPSERVVPTPPRRPSRAVLAPAQAVSRALRVQRPRDLLPVGPERDLEGLDDAAAEHAVPGVALKREHRGRAALHGDRRIVLDGNGGDESVEQLRFVREDEREAGVVHGGTIDEHTFV